MTDSFKPILVAATALAVEYKKGTKYPAWKEQAVRLNTEFNSYHGKREDRTAVEQNVYVAVREVCTVLSLPHADKELENLCVELLMFQQAMGLPQPTPESAPVVPTGEFPTVQEWANTSAWAVTHAVRQIIDDFQNGTESVSDQFFTDLVVTLTEAWKTYVDGGEAMEPKLDDQRKQAVIGFLKAHRAMRMLGDPLAPAMKALGDAFYGEPLPAAVVEDAPDPYAEEPYLYILMRNDLASMNAGKAVAQGTHAANQMVFEAMKRMRDEPSTRRGVQSAGRLNWNLVDQWQNLANGFGTCICLAVNEEQMRAAVAGAKEAGIHTNITHDPSYPLKDGGSFHLLPLDTCAYIFGKKGDCKPFVGKFPLMP